MSLEDKINLAAGTLPDGYTVAIEVENGCALVRLTRPDGTDEIVDMDCEEDIEGQFCSGCIRAQKEAGQAKT